MIVSIKNHDQTKPISIHEMEPGIMYRTKLEFGHIYVRIGDMMYVPTSGTDVYIHPLEEYAHLSFYSFKGTLEVE